MSNKTDDNSKPKKTFKDLTTLEGLNLDDIDLIKGETPPDIKESKLGPKVYGLFEVGQIQAYYRHRQFKLEEQQNPKLVTEVFQKLARVHAMDVPIKRTHWFLAEMDRFYGLVQNKLNTHINNNEYNLETFKKYDLKTEKEFIQELVVKSKSPMVFTHNDFRSANIMVLEDNNNNNNDLSDGQVNMYYKLV
ncbi:unnamed protein product [Oppiella nova]|uniref:Uncharacterized protein n=1 Tax=Oppiella nova TaxID=334625 RepID=A0A7R9M3D7_9ACAR|nr:unnamed protein product [Oppiella nova]CAG2169818.1 unnamed protein product [Oppiella nova]